MLNIRESFHEMNLKRKLFFDEFLEDSELNIMEIEILVFLNEYPDSNTFTEIMRSKGYAKSYVSKAISNLVEKEYISKQSIERNKKSFRLYLLPKSGAIIEGYETCVKAFKDVAFANISEEELEAFEMVIHKIVTNLTEE